MKTIVSSRVLNIGKYYSKQAHHMRNWILRLTSTLQIPNANEQNCLGYSNNYIFQPNFYLVH